MPIPGLHRKYTKCYHIIPRVKPRVLWISLRVFTIKEMATCVSSVVSEEPRADMSLVSRIELVLTSDNYAHICTHTSSHQRAINI